MNHNFMFGSLHLFSLGTCYQDVCTGRVHHMLQLMKNISKCSCYIFHLTANREVFPTHSWLNNGLVYILRKYVLKYFCLIKTKVSLLFLALPSVWFTHSLIIQMFIMFYIMKFGPSYFLPTCSMQAAIIATDICLFDEFCFFCIVW